MKKSSIILCGVLLLLLIITGIAYAVAKQVINGNGYMEVAKPIYETSVEEANTDNNLYSYYNVKIQNYNTNGEISMVSFNYQVTVESSDNTEMPEYYWYDQYGNIIGKELNGSLKHSEKEEQTYKICFVNSGEGEKTSNVKISTRAVQKNDDEWISADITSVSGLTMVPADSTTLTIVGPEKHNINLATEGYSFDGGNTWQSSNTKTYTQNTSNISIKVKDSNGKIYVHPEFNITNIK